MDPHGKVKPLLFFFLITFGYTFCEGLTANSSGDLVTSILWEAIEKNDPNTVLAAIESGAELGGRNTSGYTPLHHAAALGHVEVSAVLLSAGADLDAEDEHGKRPLHHAAHFGQQGTVAVLAVAGADLHANTSRGMTPLLWASLSGHNGTVALLRTLEFTSVRPAFHSEVQKSFVLNNEATDDLWTAVNNNDTAGVQAAAEIGPDFRKREKDTGKTPLHRASWDCSADVVDALLRYGAPVNEVDNDGNTALHGGALYCCDRVVTSLIKAGADLQAVGYNGLTPLQKAENNECNAALLRSLSGH